MGQRRHHYEVAFESWMRARRTPFVSVREVRKSLLPEGAQLRLTPPDADDPDQAGGRTLKSFDFVIYGDTTNLLIEVKGRKVARRKARAPRDTASSPTASPTRSRLESWVTREDIAGLTAWSRLFGPGFEAAFVFVYWCDEQPPDALFEEIFEHRGRWYALRAIRLGDYQRHMRVRSQRWGTMHLSTADFERWSVPFAPTPSPSRATPDAGGWDPEPTPVGAFAPAV